MTRFLLALAIAVAALTSSCSLPGGPPLYAVAAEVNATLASESLVVAPGDTLRLRFRLETQYDQEVVVGADGKADLLGLGSTMLSGLDTDLAVARLSESYGTLLGKDPEMSLTVAESVRTITVLGEVGAPGEIVVGPDQRLTLVEAIGQAGGFRKQSAWLSNAMLLRWDAKQQKQLWWRIDARPKNWMSEQPIYMQAFDVLYIPNTNIDHVDIWVENFIRRMLPIPVPILI